MLSFFPRDVMDEILDLIESASEGFPTYFSKSVRDALKRYFTSECFHMNRFK